MPLPNIFDKKISDVIISRINGLTPSAKPLWGKMSVAQMLAHCNVSYEMIYETIHPKPGAFMKFILKTLVKSKVTGESPYPHNSKTASQFIMKDIKDFEKEKQRLTDYIVKTQQLGAAYFDGKESHSFGKLSDTEWNNMLYKHLNHHLSQFGA